MEIEYDPGKAASNLNKHGVTFSEASTALLDEMAMAMEDPDAAGESRWVLIGMSDAARVLTIVYTLRGGTVRLISARKATKREAMQYAQGI